MNFTRRVFFGVVLFSHIILFVHCGGSGVKTAKEVAYPSFVTAAMRSDFDKAEALYSSRLFDDASISYQRYIDGYAHNRLTDEAYYKIGKIHILKHDFKKAVVLFTSLQQKSPDPVYRAKALHMTSYAWYKDANYEQAEVALDRVKPALLPMALRAQNYSLAIWIAQKTNRATLRSDESVLALFNLYNEQPSLMNTNADLVSKKQLQELIALWLARPIPSSSLPTYFRKFSDGPAKMIIAFKTAKIYFDEKKNTKAEKNLSAFVLHYPKSPYVGKAAKMLKDLGANLPTGTGENFKVGVLAPFSAVGSSGIGEAILKGVKCAANVDGACGGLTQIDVVTTDAASSIEALNTELDDLKAKGIAGAIAILPNNLASAAATHAAKLNVPLLIISQQDGLMREGNTTFQFGMSPSRQIAELADQALKKGIRRVAIFSPSIPYGQKMADLFSSTFKAKGGKVLSVLTYEKDSTDPFGDARRLKNELQAVMGTHTHIDAIFIPDTYYAVNTLANSLVANEFSGFSLLGTNTWNDPDLSQKIAENFPGSFFIDLYDSSSDSPENQEFKEGFRTTFGSTPQVLNALGYDAMLMLRAAVADFGPDRVVESLFNNSDSKGVTGVVGFREGDEPLLRPKIIELKK